MKYKYLFFDLDGTLTDSAEGITNSVEHALNKFGITVDDKSKLGRFLGPPLVPAFMEFYGFSEEDAKQAVVYYRERFSTIGLFENRVYDGIPELLTSLKSKGYKLIIATSKPEQFSVRITDHFDLTKYFDCIAGATFDGKIGTKQEVIEYAISKVGISNVSEILMIGDRHHDVEGSRALGIDCIGVLYGYGDRAELEGAGATYIAESVSDIEKIITSIQ